MRRSFESSYCLAITGPTASGKTDIAVELAREFPVEIVSMDSAMVYRGMDIGTAKPDRRITDSVPHHLIDVRDPEESYSAGQFAADAREIIREIHARGNLPLLVGGTMLYLRALRDGLADLPGRDPAIRAELDARAEAEGWEILHAELDRLDPAAAARIDPADRQRIQRALEVHAVTGKSLTELQQSRPTPGFSVDSVALMPSDRAELAEAIAGRFDRMVTKGLLDEVRGLRDRPGLRAESQSMRAVGYRQIWAHLDGVYDWEVAREKAIVATRQLAKRQLTWLKGDTRTEWLAGPRYELAERLKARIRPYLKHLTLD